MNDLVINSDTSQMNQVLDRLIKLSANDEYDPFKELVWPKSVTEGKYWMSPELMSIHGTELEHSLSEQQKIILSKWEFINFCSLNVTGIRELIIEMTLRLHTPGFEEMSEYMHVLIGEENEHMWYFSKFCNDYAGKIYPDRAISANSIDETDMVNLMIFIRVLVFEEIVDFYNRKMGKDDRLPEFIKKINWLHHLDEGRHIKYGRMYIELFFQQLQAKYSPERLRDLEMTVKTFMQVSVQKLYRREMYRDADISEPGKVRKVLIKNSARHEIDQKLVAGTARFFTKIGLFSNPDAWENTH
jgi:hypothetical protein